MIRMTKTSESYSEKKRGSESVNRSPARLKTCHRWQIINRKKLELEWIRWESESVNKSPARLETCHRWQKNAEKSESYSELDGKVKVWKGPKLGWKHVTDDKRPLETFPTSHIRLKTSTRFAIFLKILFDFTSCHSRLLSENMSNFATIYAAQSHLRWYMDVKWQELCLKVRYSELSLTRYRKWNMEILLEALGKSSWHVWEIQ